MSEQHFSDDYEDDCYTLKVNLMSDDTVIIHENDAGFVTELFLTVDEALSLASAIMSLKPKVGRAENIEVATWTCRKAVHQRRPGGNG